MHLVIFEDIGWKNLAPAALSRPVFALSTGMGTLLHKQLRCTSPSRLTLWVRPELANYTRSRIAPHLPFPTQVNAPLDSAPALLLNARAFCSTKLELPAENAAAVEPNGSVIIAHVQSPGLSADDALQSTAQWSKIQTLPTSSSPLRLTTRLWDLIAWNEQSLAEDYAALARPTPPRPAGAYHLLAEDRIWIDPEAHIQPNVVLDAAKGPIFIGQGATIGANAVLQGPCCIGPHSQVMPLALIRPGTSVGEVCKVAGEIGNSIICGYSNKAHDGYLGDSYLGKWVNLGAGTTTSNLKNTYGEISLTPPSGPLKTGRRFLGSLIGDHAKLAIGTRLMAGAYVGFSTMLAGSAIAPKFLPSFTFWTDDKTEPYRVEKAAEVIRAVFARRNRQPDEIDHAILRYVSTQAPSLET